MLTHKQILEHQFIYLNYVEGMDYRNDGPRKCIHTRIEFEDNTKYVIEGHVILTGKTKTRF